MEPGTVVRARAGRDSGGFFAVLSVSDGYAYIADGRTRRIEKPKKKKLKHLAATRQRIAPDGALTNRRLRAELARLSGEDAL